ncbi:hypothetical protein CC1G_07889 [Coprinopsis cinerea okayama7|uniref:F-box domain-containing protein n=1 Tax=Coprinopsis cinerea (strain Okayama-7 / 130 / ATCC MYA-4618 / FGSC 9003) TaxID=240176 RepID=A8P6K9_COPC7|nr:hypothetical protein CC1G_07889 [Coprinopsis cinerea okayama7\|eukprot:XP_001839174.2 hypothetical protein CC1G_07889 [Coprinopsis cinerea okayama7\
MASKEPESQSVSDVAEEREQKAQRAARRDFIDSRIAELQEEIRKWRSDRNELSPISRLPPEVLSRVFIHHQQHRTSSHVKAFDWTKVAHVSRYWRDTALGCPELWSNITTSNSHWAQAMFERSKQAPISLSFWAYWDTKPQLAEMIKSAFSQPHRLKDLKITGHNDFVHQRLEELSPSTPILRSLVLECGPGYGQSRIPDNLLGGQAPMLRDLHWTGYQFSWSTISSISSSLTSLKLSNSIPRTSDNAPSPEAFFGGFQSMKNLRELDLDLNLPIHPLSTFLIIPLPQLESLTIRGSFRECGTVMKHFALPPALSAKFYIFNSPDDTEGDVMAFGNSISSSWLAGPLSNSSYGSSCRLECISVNSDLYRAIIEANNAPEMMELVDRTRDHPTLYLRLDKNTFLPELLAALPLNDVLALNLNSSCSSHELMPLSRLPSLHTIYAERYAAEDFVFYAKADPALDMTTPDSTSEPRSGSLTRFASVKRLVFESADFEGIDMDVFLDWLMMRYELGGEIESLELNGCVRLYGEDVDRIEEVVVDVDWDGDEIECYSDEEDDEDDGDYHDGCGMPGCTPSSTAFESKERRELDG